MVLTYLLLHVAGKKGEDNIEVASKPPEKWVL